MLVTADRVLRAQAVPVEAASSIGAGDSFVGGLIWALDRHEDFEPALRYAMAAGAAALLAAGTALCRAADVDRLLPQVQLVAG